MLQSCLQDAPGGPILAPAREHLGQGPVATGLPRLQSQALDELPHRLADPLLHDQRQAQLETKAGLLGPERHGLFVRLTAWCGYLNSRASAAMVDERIAEGALEVAQATSLLSNWTGGKEDRVTVAKAQRLVDPAYLALRKKHEDAYAYRKWVEAEASNTEKDAAVVSREITRRTSHNPVDSRGRRYTA